MEPDDRVHPAAKTADPRIRRLLHDLTCIGLVLECERPGATERLLALLGDDFLRVVRAEAERAEECVQPAEDVCVAPGAAVQRFARLKRWQSSLFFSALGCGAAVAFVGVIDLISELRLLVSGIGAVGFVVAVFRHTRHAREESWIGS